MSRSVTPMRLHDRSLSEVGQGFGKRSEVLDGDRLGINRSLLSQPPAQKPAAGQAEPGCAGVQRGDYIFRHVPDEDIGHVGTSM